MEPVKVTFISSHSRDGGSEQYLEQLVKELGPRWVDRVICLQAGPLVDRLHQTEIPTEIIDTGAGLPSMLMGARRLKRSLAARPAAVIHANGVKAALVSVLAGAEKIIWVKHDFSWDGRLTRFIAGRTSLTIGVSEAVLESIPKERPTAIAYNGIESISIDRTGATTELRELVDGEGETVMLVGRLHPVKGHAELVEAAPEVLRRRPSTRFVFVGGPDPSEPTTEDAVRARILELGIDKNVVFAGHRENSTELLAGADVATIPSVRLSPRQGREGFPLVALESMMVGTPVVAYASGGVPESLGDCGVMVQEGDRAGLADAIVALLEDPARRKALSDCGRKRVRELFTMEALVDSMRNHYLQVSGG
jgi:glycosyltransferase involved in cell wall biosynthesis